MDPAAPPKTILGLMPSLQTPGFRLVDAGELAALLQYMFSARSGIKANGTTQAAATLLSAGVNEITDTTGGTAVKLPNALPGGQVTVVNDTSASLTIFPSGTDKIIDNTGLTLDASVPMSTATSSIFVSVRPGVWKQILGA